MQKPSRHSIVLLSLGILVVLAIVFPLFRSGLPWNHDKELYMVWLSEFDTGLRAGQFLPRWVPDVWFGYGSPLFNFNQPLFFYIAEGFHMVGFGFLAAVKAVLVFATIFGFWFMYLFVRRTFPRNAALLAAAAYALAPYHLGLMYNRGAYAEYLAMAWLPLIFYCFSKIGDRQTPGRFFLGAFSVALILLTHNLSTMLYLPVLVVFLFLVLPKKLKSFIWSFGALGAGLLLSAFFWLPAFFERRFLYLANLTTGPYDFHFRFTTLRNLLFSHYWDDLDIYFQISFLASLALLVAALLALRHWRSKRKESIRIFFFLCVALISIFFINGSSKSVWEHVPLMSYLQFPWRFLSLVDFSAAFCIGVVGWPEIQKIFLWAWRKIVGAREYRETVVVVVILGIFLWAFAPYYRVAEFFPQKSDTKYTPYEQVASQFYASPILDTFIVKTSIFPNIGNIKKLEYQANHTAYLMYEALQKSKAYQTPPAEVVDGKADIHMDSANAISRDLRVSASTQATVRINIFWFPGWQATLDGVPVALSADKDIGVMLVRVPAGSHALRLRFTNTPIRTAADLLSIIGCVGVAGFLAWPRRKKTPFSLPSIRGTL